MPSPWSRSVSGSRRWGASPARRGRGRRAARRSSLLTRLPASARSPNTIAPVGQACWQAVATSPSASGRRCSSAWFLPSWMRWTQRLHFSITPRLRTVTSGFSTSRPSGLCHVVGEVVAGGEVVPVEPADLVWAVVRAVARADAAVVDLLVDALGAGRRRQHGADRLARRVLAVLAHHRLVHARARPRRRPRSNGRCAASA